MKFEVKKFSTVRISVLNVEKSSRWFEAFFGVPPVEEMDNFVSFRIGATLLDLALADEKSPVSRGGSVGYWLVSDLEAATQHAESLGGKIYRGPLRVQETESTIVQIECPFGGIIGLEAVFT